VCANGSIFSFQNATQKHRYRSCEHQVNKNVEQHPPGGDNPFVQEEERSESPSILKKKVDEDVLQKVDEDLLQKVDEDLLNNVFVGSASGMVPSSDRGAHSIAASSECHPQNSNNIDLRTSHSDKASGGVADPGTRRNPLGPLPVCLQRNSRRFLL